MPRPHRDAHLVNHRGPTPEFAAQIGADGFAPDAGSAVDLARRLLAG